jgi:hypothetical protein
MVNEARDNMPDQTPIPCHISVVSASPHCRHFFLVTYPLLLPSQLSTRCYSTACLITSYLEPKPLILKKWFITLSHFFFSSSSPCVFHGPHLIFIRSMLAFHVEGATLSASSMNTTKTFKLCVRGANPYQLSMTYDFCQNQGLVGPMGICFVIIFESTVLGPCAGRVLAVLSAEDNCKEFRTIPAAAPLVILEDPMKKLLEVHPQFPPSMTCHAPSPTYHPYKYNITDRLCIHASIGLNLMDPDSPCQMHQWLLVIATIPAQLLPTTTNRTFSPYVIQPLTLQEVLSSVRLECSYPLNLLCDVFFNSNKAVSAPPGTQALDVQIDACHYSGLSPTSNIEQLLQVDEDERGLSASVERRGSN